MVNSLNNNSKTNVTAGSIEFTVMFKYKNKNPHFIQAQQTAGDRGHSL